VYVAPHAKQNDLWVLDGEDQDEEEDHDALEKGHGVLEKGFRF